MKANELRIGNLVEFDNSVGVLDGISIHGEIILEWKGSIIDIFIEDIELINPIPLTEEWLVRFGFYQSKNKWGNTFHLMNEDGITADFTVEHWTNTKESSPYKNYWLIDKLGKPRQYYHVHQLQNLYFALCGEELTLNNQ